MGVLVFIIKQSYLRALWGADRISALAKVVLLSACLPHRIRDTHLCVLNHLDSLCTAAAAVAAFWAVSSSPFCDEMGVGSHGSSSGCSRLAEAPSEKYLVMIILKS